MRSPWHLVPLADYEGHMQSAEVAQLPVLSDLFAEALAATHPESVAILGIAGGNGLERIDPAVTKRIVGIDVVQEYLDAIPARYPHLPGLELHHADLSAFALDIPPVDLVHAALIFEHAGVGHCLDNAAKLVKHGGTLAAVLQLPSETASGVGFSPFASLQHPPPTSS
jgi:hypothetical protein